MGSKLFLFSVIFLFLIGVVSATFGINNEIPNPGHGIAEFIDNPTPGFACHGKLLAWVQDLNPHWECIEPSAGSQWANSGNGIFYNEDGKSVGIGFNLAGNPTSASLAVSTIGTGKTQAISGRYGADGPQGMLGTNTEGVYGYGGKGVKGVGINYGVYGENPFGGTFGYLGGENYGVYGLNTGTNNPAVMGENPGTNTYGTLGSTYGVYGKNTAYGSVGYLGGIHGVSGVANNAAVYGVYGENSAGGFAGFFGGRLKATSGVIFSGLPKGNSGLKRVCIDASGNLYKEGC